MHQALAVGERAQHAGAECGEARSDLRHAGAVAGRIIDSNVGGRERGGGRAHLVRALERRPRGVGRRRFGARLAPRSREFGAPRTREKFGRAHFARADRARGRERGHGQHRQQRGERQSIWPRCGAHAFESRTALAGAPMQARAGIEGARAGNARALSELRRRDAKRAPGALYIDVGPGEPARASGHAHLVGHAAGRTRRE